VAVVLAVVVVVVVEAVGAVWAWINAQGTSMVTSMATSRECLGVFFIIGVQFGW
jgi:hypothetical protein